LNGVKSTGIGGGKIAGESTGGKTAGAGAGWKTQRVPEFFQALEPE
jgi:hypothetical protein